MMDENQVKGGAQEAVGKVKDAAGGLIGDAGTQAEGKMDQSAGELKAQFGGAAARAGDMANEAARGLSDAAATARVTAGVVGGKVYDAGARAGQYEGETVKQQPHLSLIGAAAIGYAIAFPLHAPSCR